MQGTRGVWALSMLALVACGSDSDDDKQSGTPEDQAIESAKGHVTQELQALHDAAHELEEAAPAPDADGWNATADAAAVNKMKAAWAKARDSYERVEGAIAALFPDLDESSDQRYDFFVENAAD